jgi:hypothetical protein
MPYVRGGANRVRESCQRPANILRALVRESLSFEEMIMDIEVKSSCEQH